MSDSDYKRGFNDGKARYEGALRTIAGPEDRGPWIEIYRAAGGGYEGLQEIARYALASQEGPG